MIDGGQGRPPQPADGDPDDLDGLGDEAATVVTVSEEVMKVLAEDPKPRMFDNKDVDAAVDGFDEDSVREHTIIAAMPPPPKASDGTGPSPVARPTPPPARASRPSQPAMRPSQPVQRPSQPVMRPSQPAFPPSQPVQRPSQPAFAPPQPPFPQQAPYAQSASYPQQVAPQYPPQPPYAQPMPYAQPAPYVPQQPTPYPQPYMQGTPSVMQPVYTPSIQAPAIVPDAAPAPKKSRGKLWAIAIVLVLLGAGGGVAAYVVTQDSSSDDTTSSKSPPSDKPTPTPTPTPTPPPTPPTDKVATTTTDPVKPPPKPPEPTPPTPPPTPPTPPTPPAPAPLTVEVTTLEHVTTATVTASARGNVVKVNAGNAVRKQGDLVVELAFRQTGGARVAELNKRIAELQQLVKQDPDTYEPFLQRARRDLDRAQPTVQTNVTAPAAGTFRSRVKVGDTVKQGDTLGAMLDTRTWTATVTAHASVTATWSCAIADATHTAACKIRSTEATGGDTKVTVEIDASVAPWLTGVDQHPSLIFTH